MQVGASDPRDAYTRAGTAFAAADLARPGGQARRAAEPHCGAAAPGEIRGARSKARHMQMPRCISNLLSGLPGSDVGSIEELLGLIACCSFLLECMRTFIKI